MHGNLWALLLLLVIAVGCGGCRQKRATGRADRIITLSPSLTQMVFALGEGDRIRAVTKYDYRPPAVRRLPKVGGFLDIDLERLLSHKPDLVLLTEMHSRLATSLRGVGVPYLEVRTRSIAEVYSAIGLLGERLGHPERAHTLIANLKKALAPRACATRPRVLVTLGRNRGSLKNLVAAGRGTYLDELLRLAGAVNVMGSGPASYPRLSEEELVGFAPDVVLDIVTSGYSKEPWAKVSFRNNVSIVLLTEPTISSPGVHMGETLTIMHRAICPGGATAM